MLAEHYQGIPKISCPRDVDCVTSALIFQSSEYEQMKNYSKKLFSCALLTALESGSVWLFPFFICDSSNVIMAADQRTPLSIHKHRKCTECTIRNPWNTQCLQVEEERRSGLLKSLGQMRTLEGTAQAVRLLPKFREVYGMPRRTCVEKSVVSRIVKYVYHTSNVSIPMYTYPNLCGYRVHVEHVRKPRKKKKNWQQKLHDKVTNFQGSKSAFKA